MVNVWRKVKPRKEIGSSGWGAATSNGVAWANVSEKKFE